MLKPDFPFLKKKIERLSAGAGVYLFKDNQQKIIYIGKALNLKNRIRSYFRNILEEDSAPLKNLSADYKTNFLVQKIFDFDAILTDTESEALILESNLIKKHQPRYNVRLKDDKGYPYICITSGERFPRIFITRRSGRKGNFHISGVAQSKSLPEVHSASGKFAQASVPNRFFGPYTDVRNLKKIVNLLQSIFKIRNCKLRLPLQKRDRPCLEFDMKRCLAPCVDYISEEEYQANVAQLLRFMEGNVSEVMLDLESKIKEHAAKLEFEKATRLRDQLEELGSLAVQQKIDLLNSENLDILGFASLAEESCIVRFQIRNGRVLDRSHFFFSALGQWPEDEFIKAFIRDVYIDQEGAVIPSVICLDIFMKEGKPYEDILSYLAGHKVKIESYPRQDDTLAEEDMPMERLNDDGQSGRRQNVSGLLRLARKNAMMILKEESFKKSFRDKQGALLEIQKKLHLDKIPTVIQCLDISNLQDKSMVASLVSFRDGIPEKNQYRRYKLKLAKGSADDYAAIHEVTERLLKRIEKGEKTAPDLLLIDGGPGQLGAALMAKQQSTMNLGISMAAIAKKEEDIFLPHKNSPIRWDKNSRGKLLLRLIRDEAHRFAITYHRLLRNREGLQSILDAIPGIGKETRVKIQKIFKDHDNLQGITQEELRKIPGIGKKLAARIHRLIAKDDPSAEI